MADKALCSIPDCGKVAERRGWCRTHHGRWQRHGDPLVCLLLKGGICSVENCGRATVGRGLCQVHYRKWRLSDENQTKCITQGCRRPIHGKGKCELHYQQDVAARKTSICSVDGCERKERVVGLCVRHYKRKIRYGDPQKGQHERGLTLKLFEELKGWSDAKNCFYWPYSTNRLGIAQIRIGGILLNIPRALCEFRHGPPPTPKHQAAHSCGMGHKACVNPMHLSWKTQRENEADKLIHGTRKRGEDHYAAHLTNEQVRDLRRRYELGEKTQAELAREFGITQSCASNILHRKTYAHI